MVKHTGTRPRLKFTGGGRGLAVHAGSRLLADLADATGLTAALSEAMAGVNVRDRGHDRGRVLADAAVMIADGGERICDIAALAVLDDALAQIPVDPHHTEVTANRGDRQSRLRRSVEGVPGGVPRAQGPLLRRPQAQHRHRADHH